MKKNRILTEVDVDYIENRFKQLFLTKGEFIQYKSNLIDKLDKILKEVIAGREEQTVLAHQTSNHENRLKSL